MASTNHIISADSPESVMGIYPDSGPSMHAYTAVSDNVIIFDIIGPPYGDGRPCSYFKEIGVETPEGTLEFRKSLDLSAQKRLCWLTSSPESETECLEQAYTGDQVVEDALRMLEYLPSTMDILKGVPGNNSSEDSTASRILKQAGNKI